MTWWWEKSALSSWWKRKLGCRMCDLKILANHILVLKKWSLLNANVTRLNPQSDDMFSIVFPGQIIYRPISTELCKDATLTSSNPRRNRKSNYKVGPDPVMLVELYITPINGLKKWVCLGLVHPTYRGCNCNPICNWIRGPSSWRTRGHIRPFIKTFGPK